MEDAQIKAAITEEMKRAAAEIAKDNEYLSHWKGYMAACGELMVKLFGNFWPKEMAKEDSSSKHAENKDLAGRSA